MNKSDNFEIRKIQALTGDRSLTLVFPKHFAQQLGVEKGDFLKCHVEDSRLIVQRLDTDKQNE
jgi:bifunctional DNA-binding transcriptional regulator/antitoxin component of YhaV-PrlF toxin-antitoxin module